MLKPVFVLILFLSTPCLAQSGLKLRGNLVDDNGRPMPNVTIVLAGIDTINTGKDGSFRITMPNRVTEGQLVTIKVIKKGWVINHPLDGNWNLPNLREQNVRLLKIIIVPKGSKALWTHARIERYIAKLSDEIAKLKKESETPKPVDFSSYINEWAKDSGFTAGEVKALFDQWAKSAESSEDYKKLGLAAFYKKNFLEAAKFFDKEAASGVEDVKRSEKKLYEAKRKTYEGFKYAGNSYSESSKFRDALERYTGAAGYISKDEDGTEWAEIRLLIGKTKALLGNGNESEEGHRLLVEAVEEYDQVLTVYTREQYPRQWAYTQAYLGMTLTSLGGISTQKERIDSLERAIRALRLALEVYTYEQTPLEWSLSLASLGIAQHTLGMSLIDQGDKATHLLEQAVESFKLAAKVKVDDKPPQQWATIQASLGMTLFMQGERLGGEQGFKMVVQAVEALRLAAAGIDKERWPLPWASVHTALGRALVAQESMGGGEDSTLLVRAVEAFKHAITVYTPERLPRMWGATQTNIGLALLILAVQQNGEQKAKLATQAVEAFKQALIAYTRERMPDDWGKTQHYLGNAYFLLKDWNTALNHFHNDLLVHPDCEESNLRVGAITHEVLFSFAESFEIRRRYVENHPDDLSAQCDFAENNFTTARFAECEKLITALLANPALNASANTALRIVEVANVIALGKAEMAPHKLDELIELVSIQPADFKVNWTFNGTLHFIGQDEKLGPNRAWLKLLFGAAQADNRDSILKALRDAQAAFKK